MDTEKCRGSRSAIPKTKRLGPGSSAHSRKRGPSGVRPVIFDGPPLVERSGPTLSARGVVAALPGTLTQRHQKTGKTDVSQERSARARA